MSRGQTLLRRAAAKPDSCVQGTGCSTARFGSALGFLVAFRHRCKFICTNPYLINFSGLQTSLDTRVKTHVSLHYLGEP